MFIFVQIMWVHRNIWAIACLVKCVLCLIGFPVCLIMWWSCENQLWFVWIMEARVFTSEQTPCEFLPWGFLINLGCVVVCVSCTSFKMPDVVYSRAFICLCVKGLSWATSSPDPGWVCSGSGCWRRWAGRMLVLRVCWRWICCRSGMSVGVLRTRWRWSWVKARRCCAVWMQQVPWASGTSLRAEELSTHSSTPAPSESQPAALTDLTPH